MQAEDKGVDTGISKTQVDEPFSHYKKHNSREDIQGNSYGSHEESGNKPAGSMVRQDHPEVQAMRTEEKSLSYGQHEKTKHGSPEQHEETKRAA